MVYNGANFRAALAQSDDKSWDATHAVSRESAPSLMITILAIAVFLMAAFDARLTARRIEKYGTKVELNEAIAKLSTRIGSEAAALIGIMVPNAILIGVAYSLDAKLLMAGLVGFKLRYFWNQIQSLKFERNALAIAREINSRAAVQDNPPPASSQSDDSSLGGPKSSM